MGYTAVSGTKGVGWARKSHLAYDLALTLHSGQQLEWHTSRPRPTGTVYAVALDSSDGVIL